MAATTPPSMTVGDLPERRGSRYPPPFDKPCLARSNRNLGDPFGLKDFGVHLLTLEPGGWSSQRHWHTHEDELVYVIEGTPTLVTDEGETALAPGSVAGFPAGTGNGHHIVNNSGAVARLIVVGSRKKEDDCYYSDIDMQLLQHAAGGVFAHKNGEPY
ncbi:MAG TPA: cupin domain-containing protein [Gammaproteobacteria bacterium]|nr:cupin domain-containing protein [Gammaproteobacteria bacterium]